MPGNVPIDRRKLFEQVATYLEQDILNGVLKPGDRLPPERELQDRFGVGRPSIREALISLQRTGLVEQINGMPARVTKARAEDVVANIGPAVRQMLGGAEGQRQLQSLRLFVEVGLVRHAARHATDEEVEQVRQALEDNRKAGQNAELFIKSDVALHYQFAKIMDNPIFLAVHSAMTEWLREQRIVALTEPGEYERSYAAHVKIYEAVSKRDADAAEEAMRAHLASGFSAFWNRYEERE